jgi:hypothetical protein
MTTSALQILFILSCTTIMYQTVVTVYSMSWRSNYFVWAYQALLGTGALWTCLQIINGWMPSIGTGLILLGIGGQYLFERRRSSRVAEMRHGRY